MANQTRPVLIAGGGIGGCATALALSRVGIASRVFEQAPEFREVGAGIQLGPNIFKAFDKLGLKDALPAIAWFRRRAGDARRASPASTCHHIPLERRLHQPLPAALCGHPSRRHSCHVSQGLPGQQPDHAGNQPAREVFAHEDSGDGVTVTLRGRRTVREARR